MPASSLHVKFDTKSPPRGEGGRHALHRKRNAHDGLAKSYTEGGMPLIGRSANCTRPGTWAGAMA